MVPYPLINGTRYDFASIEARFNNLIVLGFKELTFKNALEPGEVFGASAQLLGHTLGQYKPEAGFTMFKSEYDDFILSLGDGYMTIRFDIIASFNNDGEPMSDVEIHGARIKSEEESHSAGTDALVVKVELAPLYILKNGLSPIPNLRM